VTRITVDVNDGWLEAARAVLGTDTKVATINEALRIQALKAEAAGILAGTSAYVAQARHPGARGRFAALLTEGRLAVCQMTIAATAEEHAATVLHYDADYDRIAAVTGQPVEWVAPRGSL
jgi:predicted nucleic acid-binding protein